MTDTTAHLAYHRLKADILAVELRPGETLTETRLCELLCTSRTTVRAALARLENEGLVRKEGRSYTVAPIDISEIQQAFDYREVLEVGALRLGFAQLTPERLAAVQARLGDVTDDTPIEDYMDRATRFHVDLARLSGNDFIVRSLEDVLVRLSRARWLEAQGREGRARAHADHLHLLALIGQGDLNGACEHVQTHLRRSRDRLTAALIDERRKLNLHGLAVVL